MADVAGLVKPRGGAMRDELGSEGDGLASRRRELGRPRLGRSSACRSGLASEFHPPQIERVAGYRHTAPSPSPRLAPLPQKVAAAAVSPGTSVTSMNPGSGLTLNFVPLWGIIGAR
ncbi:unnamed protein product [Urochloa humidicola]